MKKILSVIIAIISVISVSAQDIDSLQSKSISIENLTTQLNNLQRDYDYLLCESKLQMKMNELSIFNNLLNITINTITTYVCNNLFDVDLYIAYRDSYNAYVNMLNAQKRNVLSLQELVVTKMNVTDFYDIEIELLNNSMRLLDSSLNRIELSLTDLKNAIDAYKNVK